MKKSLANNKVNKALSPEEMTVLENIGSLVQQLTSSGGAEMENEVMNAGVVPEEEPEDPNAIMKESNGPTANPEDKAENRVEDPTDITAGNLSEVGKSLGLLLQLMNVNKSAPAQSVQKSAPAGDQVNTAVLKSLAEISNVMKSLADQQNQQNTAISNILDGIGFSENVQKSLDNRPKPVQNLDGAGLMNELLGVMKSIQNGQNTPQNNNSAWNNVRKSGHEELRDSLPALFGIK